MFVLINLVAACGAWRRATPENSSIDELDSERGEMGRKSNTLSAFKLWRLVGFCLPASAQPEVCLGGPGLWPF